MSLSVSAPISHTSGEAFGIPALRSRLMDPSTNYLRQALHAKAPEPAVAVKQKDWFSVVDTMPKNARVPALRGLRVTMGIEKILRLVGRHAGPHGDRFFMHQRAIAESTGYNVRTVGEALRLGVATGLLIRHTHGAGGSRKPGAYKKQGASYQLSFPGGEAGIADTRQWLADRLKGRRRLSDAERTRRTRVEESNRQAAEFIRKNPDMVRLISQTLGRAPNAEGATRVVATILYRTNTRVRHLRKYVLSAVENDARAGGELAEHYPPISTQGANAAQAKIAQLLAGLYKPPDL